MSVRDLVKNLLHVNAALLQAYCKEGYYGKGAMERQWDATEDIKKYDCGHIKIGKKEEVEGIQECDLCT